MLSRRTFCRDLVGGAAGAMLLGGDVLAARQSPQTGVRRREVSIGGRRIKVVDVHAHCSIAEVAPIVRGSNLAAGGQGTGTPMRLLMDAMALRKRPDVGNPRPWTVGALAAGGVAVAARGVAKRAPRRP